MASQQSVKVCCRVYGQSEFEKEALEKGYIFLDGKSILHESSGRIYNFDKIFDQNSSQNQIYEEVAKPIVSNVLCGYNGTILVYGQTPNDKSYTMEGDASASEKFGIIPRAAKDIFACVESLKISVNYEIKISYFMIYLEKIYDVFSDFKDVLQVYDDKNGLPFVVGCKTFLVKNTQELMELYNEAKMKRFEALGSVKEMTSKSHTIFQIVIKQDNLVTGEILMSKLLLVDLAGSKQTCKRNPNDSLIQRESKFINRSLSVLSRVILLLNKKKVDGIPYRESALTRLVKESLGGNSQTAIFVCIRPSAEKGIKWSLEFGCRAKIVQNNFYLNVEVNRKKLNKFWKKLQVYISRTNKYIYETTAELQKWRNGEDVPEEEWISPFEYNEGDSFSDSYFMDSSMTDTLDLTHSFQEQLDNQILHDSSLTNESTHVLNETFEIPDSEDHSSLSDEMEFPMEIIQLKKSKGENMKHKEEYTEKMVPWINIDYKHADKRKMSFPSKKHEDSRPLTNNQSTQTENEELEVINKQLKAEMVLIKEDSVKDLMYYKDINTTLRENMEGVTQEKESQESMCNELSCMLKAEKEQNAILRENMEKVTQEVKSQKNLCNELSNLLKAEKEQNKTQHTLKNVYIQQRNDLKEIVDNFSEHFSQKHSSEGDDESPTLTSFTEKNLSISEKFNNITGEELRARLQAENIQNHLNELAIQLRSLSEDRVLQNQILASKDCENNKIISLMREIRCLGESHAAKEQALSALIAENLQQINAISLEESLRDDSIENNVLRLCDRLQNLSQKCEFQERKVVEVSEKIDTAQESTKLLEKEIHDFGKRRDTVEQNLRAEINQLCDDKEMLKLELEETSSINSQYFSRIDSLKEKMEDASVTVSNLRDKINLVGQDLDMERDRHKEDIARLEICLLEKANAEQLLVKKLCSLQIENQALVDELVKVYSRQRILEEESENMLMILKNYSNRHPKSFENGEVASIKIKEPSRLKDDCCDHGSANSNETSSVDLSVRKKFVTELKHLFSECETIETLQKSFFSKFLEDSFDGKEFLKEAIEYFQA